MYVSHLSLVDFRCYEHVDVEFEPGVSVLVGRNGQGKTNLVEALSYVATLSSHRVSSDTALIRAGMERAIVRTRVVRDVRASVIELEITKGKANRARLNRGAPGRTRDILGLLRTVVFAPEDLVLVKGDPDARRRFLDELTVALMPRMAGVLSDYERVVRQRSALLKSAGGRSRIDDDGLRTLEIWDGKLAELGAQIVLVRQKILTALRPFVARAYETVSSAQSEARISYQPSVLGVLGDSPAAEAETVTLAEDVAGIAGQLMDALVAVRSRELDRGVCLVGPHRDDVYLGLDELPMRGYASHGESWSMALALRLASYWLLSGDEAGANTVVTPSANLPKSADLSGGDAENLHEKAGSRDEELWSSDWGADGEPVLILDDVFAELDSQRRSRLAEVVAQARQVMITSAVSDDVPAELGGIRYRVDGGAVTRE